MGAAEAPDIDGLQTADPAIVLDHQGPGSPKRFCDVCPGVEPEGSDRIAGGSDCYLTKCRYPGGT